MVLTTSSDSNNAPLFSIIVAVYNTAQYLDKCISSILNQSFRDFELILVDDGSDDESKSICDNYASRDTRVRVLQTAHSGVSVARNTGLDNAKGRCVAFIDSDDWIEGCYLQTISDNVDDSDIMFFGSVWHLSDGCSRSISFKTERYDGSDTDNGLIHLWINQTGCNYSTGACNKVFRNEIIQKYNIRFVPGLSYAEDQIFTLNYYKYVKSLKIIDAVLYHYQFRSKSLSNNTIDKTNYTVQIAEFEKILKDTRNPQLIKIFKRQIAFAYNDYAWSTGNPLKIVARLLRLIAECVKRGLDWD